MRRRQRNAASGAWGAGLRKVCGEGGMNRRTKIIRNLIQRDGQMCCWCHRKTSVDCDPEDPLFATIEHVVRKADGGSNQFSNLKVACRSCNVRRQHTQEQPVFTRTLRGGEEQKVMKFKNHWCEAGFLADGTPLWVRTKRAGVAHSINCLDANVCDEFLRHLRAEYSR